jgi:adenosylcobinamide-GDP ribazoletransferase
VASLILAVRFLTIVPLPGREASGPDALGRAAWWFPVVGLLLGAALAALDRLLSLVFPPLLSSLLVVSSWKVATGGVHLDGLADCLDGFGGATREQRLAIMRDSHIGVFGAAGIVLVFLIGLVGLAELTQGRRWRVLFLAPAVGRLAPVLVGRWFAPATPEQGMGAAFLRALPSMAGPLHLVLIVALAMALFGGWGVMMVLAPLIAVLAWISFVSGRVGGLTGDALGAGVELAELGCLLTAVALSHVGTR